MAVPGSGERERLSLARLRWAGVGGGGVCFSCSCARLQRGESVAIYVLLSTTCFPLQATTTWTGLSSQTQTTHPAPINGPCLLLATTISSDTILLVGPSVFPGQGISSRKYSRPFYPLSLQTPLLALPPPVSFWWVIVDGSTNREQCEGAGRLPIELMQAGM